MVPCFYSHGLLSLMASELRLKGLGFAGLQTTPGPSLSSPRPQILYTLNRWSWRNVERSTNQSTAYEYHWNFYMPWETKIRERIFGRVGYEQQMYKKTRGWVTHEPEQPTRPQVSPHSCDSRHPKHPTKLYQEPIKTDKHFAENERNRENSFLNCIFRDLWNMRELQVRNLA